MEKVMKELENQGWIRDEYEEDIVYTQEWNASNCEASGDYEPQDPDVYADVYADEYIEYILNLTTRSATFTQYLDGEANAAISEEDDYESVLEEALQGTLFIPIEKLDTRTILGNSDSGKMEEVWLDLLQVKKDFSSCFYDFKKGQFCIETQLNYSDARISIRKITNEEAEEIQIDPSLLENMEQIQ